MGGEARVGKTALVRRFGDEHRQSTRIFTAKCDALFTRGCSGRSSTAEAVGGAYGIAGGDVRPRDVAVAVLEELSSGSRILRNCPEVPIAGN